MVICYLSCNIDCSFFNFIIIYISFKTFGNTDPTRTSLDAKSYCQTRQNSSNSTRVQFCAKYKQSSVEKSSNSKTRLQMLNPRSVKPAIFLLNSPSPPLTGVDPAQPILVPRRTNWTDSDRETPPKGNWEEEADIDLERKGKIKGSFVPFGPRYILRGFGIHWLKKVIIIIIIISICSNLFNKIIESK